MAAASKKQSPQVKPVEPNIPDFGVPVPGASSTWPLGSMWAKQKAQPEVMTKPDGVMDLTPKAVEEQQRQFKATVAQAEPLQYKQEDKINIRKATPDEDKRFAEIDAQNAKDEKEAAKTGDRTKVIAHKRKLKTQGRA